ncbi:alpha-1,2-fucosyltransferase [Haloferula rosea]|uniref:Alpha-1,2-fucosyltransferase n=1 Tax=Haloferula rosea TaxID=490093 RepID=A0A934REU6_9BACT|nr:alpha-1,2-fucosyltransferase [Haloferula rosea]MBK1827831.1 alpha-1,2-fucosyltransferase [Haloferula rosea]
MLDSPGNCVVLGFFQSPLYFSAIDPVLRRELATDGLGLETGFEALADRLREPSSVAVHVRRSDYVGNRDVARLDHDYYLRAMNRIRESVRGARFHVFSDDPVWCSGVFNGRDVSVNEHSDPFAPLVDLHLMSLASHHIIANSTFSWWGAWLGTKPGQQVLMPDVWFERGIHAPIEEKLLEGWQLMPVRSGSS